MKQYHKNPRQITKQQYSDLETWLLELGDLSGIVHDLNSDEIISGNQRSRVFDIEKCDVEITERYDEPDEQGTVALGFIIWEGKKYGYRQVRWDERKCEKANIIANKAGGGWDFDLLANNFEFDDLIDWGFSEKELLGLDFGGEPPADDPGAQMDKANELREKWDVCLGQLWQLGEHRLICGDCTDKAAVERMMQGEKAVLCHADPPYGMGKENEGIENDNLYREKLDAFQMEWWKAGRLFFENNASIYIWGTDEDLWRLWYHNLKDSERLTFRNEIVWEKQGAQGIGSDAHRMYPTASERCLFFMLGEQGFSINADNYWNGWTPIVDYLESQRQLMGWSIKDTKRIAGHSENSGCHWFDKSQWNMPTEEVYKAWQKAARDYGGFKRDYEEVKRDYYATRAYFDNAHDNMTDVWHYDRVIGEERQGHATPKPIIMAERAIMSSTPKNAIVYVPFGGTLPELIACERLGRKCRAVEISPAYCAVAIERFYQMTNIDPVLLEPAT